MSNVVALDPPAAEAEKPAHRRLRLMSKALALLFTGLTALPVLYVLAAAAVALCFSQYVQMNAEGAWLGVGPHGAQPPLQPGMVRFSDQPLATHLAGIADVTLAMTPFFFVFLHLRGLFRLYAAGTVFARDNAVHLKHIGLWLIAYPIVKLASNLIFRLAGGLDHNWLHVTSLQALVLGLIVVAIAQVMECGREIEQEKDSFV